MHNMQLLSPARLHHLHLSSEDPARLADFYVRMLDMAAEPLPDGRILLRGRERNFLLSKGPSRTVQASCYTLQSRDGLEALRRHLVGTGVPLEASDTPFFGSDAFAVRDPQGRKVIFGLAPGAGNASEGMPGRLQHIVFQTTQLDAIVDFYANKVGYVISDEVVNDDNSLAVCFLRSDDEHHSRAFFKGSQNDDDHFCFETSGWNDIRDWGDRFARARIPIFFGPGRHGPGNNLFFMVTDVDGNRLEFSAEIEVVSKDHTPGVWPNTEYTLNSWGRSWMRT